jgi:hypothetical protein
MTAAGVLALAALSVAGIWVPGSWWRPLAVLGAGLLLALMLLFLGPTKLIPVAAALTTLYLALVRPATVAVE